MKRPWMPLYVGDYLGDTGHLTTTQHGAYLLLMMHYWRKGELPDDDKQLSKITKLPLKTWCDYRPTLQDFFHEGWKHKRIDAELGEDDARFRKARDCRAEGRHRFGAGAHEAGKRRAVPARAIASNCCAIVEQAGGSVDHSHSHKNLLKSEASAAGRPEPQPEGRTEKSSIAVSPELAAYVARRTTNAANGKSTVQILPSWRQSDMARARRNKPHSLTKIHDRRSNDLPRNAEVAAVEVDDPLALEPGEKIVTLRSLRNDPLGRLHSHRQIDEAQYQGGRAFQDDWEKAERGPQAVDPTREYVDGGQAREPITERQRKAVLRLNRAERELGADGSALVHEVLILGLTMEQIGQRRGLRGQRWIDYFARRFRECLDRLALIYGFATERR